MKYVMIFAGIVYGVEWFVEVLKEWAEVELTSSISLIYPILASYCITELFARDHKRAPTEPEKRRMVIGAFTVIMTISFLIAAVLLRYDTGHLHVLIELSLDWKFKLAICAFVFAIYFAIIWLGFSCFTSIVEKRLKKSLGNKPP